MPTSDIINKYMPTSDIINKYMPASDIINKCMPTSDICHWAADWVMGNICFSFNNSGLWELKFTYEAKQNEFENTTVVYSKCFKLSTLHKAHAKKWPPKYHCQTGETESPNKNIVIFLFLVKKETTHNNSVKQLNKKSIIYLAPGMNTIFRRV